MPGGEKFALGVCPLIFSGAGYVEWAWCDQGQELVLIKWQQGLSIIEACESIVEPMGK
jgi:hypothetical protein